MSVRAARASSELRLSRPTQWTDDYPWSPPEPVRPVTMVQRWARLSFLHWPFAPERVASILPAGLDLDIIEGSAWVGLLPFRLTLRFPGLPAIPWASTTPEVNLRTYVRGPDGRPGIWFLSLEAARLGAVLVARSWYRLPYLWAEARIDDAGRRVRYRTRRRWPALRRPSADIEVFPQESIEPEDLTQLERFLMARWRLYSPVTGGLAATQVSHSPWPLQRAALSRFEQRDLLRAAGLPEPEGIPLVHFSPGVVTRFGPRRRVL